MVFSQQRGSGGSGRPGLGHGSKDATPCGQPQVIGFFRYPFDPLPLESCIVSLALSLLQGFMKDCSDDYIFWCGAGRSLKKKGGSLLVAVDFPEFFL